MPEEIQSEKLGKLGCKETAQIKRRVNTKTFKPSQSTQQETKPINSCQKPFDKISEEAWLKVRMSENKIKT